MKVTMEDGGACRKILHIHADPEAVLPKYKEVAGQFAQMAPVSGFRRGKAPLSVVEGRYRKDIINETAEAMVPVLYRQALKEQNISPVAIVDVGGVRMDISEGLTFRVTVDVAPEFKLPKYRKIPLVEDKREVGQEDVEKSYKELLRAHARYDDAKDRKSQKGDLVVFHYTGECDGKPVDSMVAKTAGIGSGRDFMMLLEEGREFLPGFLDGLQGMAPGEKKDVTVSFPADFRVAELTGKQAVYHVEIVSIRQLVLPTVDAEFLKQFEVESEAALKDKVKARLQANAAEERQRRYQDEIAKYLLENTKFDLPQSIVEQETRLMVRDMVSRVVRQGATREDLMEHQEEIVKTATRNSEDRVRLSYILSRIADEEKIDVAEDEMNTHIKELAERHGMPEERLRAELTKRNSMEGIRSSLRSDKTMAVLIQQAKMK